MSYCREHHHDLVHITTNNIQEQVAERAKNATSAHVWLGLRYTCKFNFWFWTKSNSGCYQNWAPGQGSERTYDCGVTGAIEATGRQQWVGMPNTEKLNFICTACVGWVWRESDTSDAKDAAVLILLCAGITPLCWLSLYCFSCWFDIQTHVLTIAAVSQQTLTGFNVDIMVILMLTYDVRLLPLLKYSCLLYCWAWISLNMKNSCGVWACTFTVMGSKSNVRTLICSMPFTRG